MLSCAIRTIITKEKVSKGEMEKKGNMMMMEKDKGEYGKVRA